MGAIEPDRIVSLADVATALTLLNSIYGDRVKLGKEVAAAWHAALADMGARELSGAVGAWMRAEKWPPTPADLRRLVPRLCDCGTCSTCHWRQYRQRTGQPEPAYMLPPTEDRPALPTATRELTR